LFIWLYYFLLEFIYWTPRYSWNIAKVSFNTNQSIFWQLNCLFFNLPLQITSCYLQTFLHFADSKQLVNTYFNQEVIWRGKLKKRQFNCQKIDWLVLKLTLAIFQLYRGVVRRKGTKQQAMVHKTLTRDILKWTVFTASDYLLVSPDLSCRYGSRIKQTIAKHKF
jgi:hypothetical protein